MVIRRVGPVSCAKIAGLLYAVMGLAIGAVFAMFSLAGRFAGASDPGMGFPPSFAGVGAVLVLPIVYGVIGFVMTLIMAALFNVAAAAVGGVEIDVQ